MIISLTQFAGVAPRNAPHLLRPEQAQVAINCAPWGSLKPLSDTIQVQSGLSGTTSSTIYKFGGTFGRDDLYWFHWPDKAVDVVKGAISGDVSERTYFIKDGVAYKTNNSLALTGGSGDYPWNSKRLGVPAPNSALTVTLDASAIGDPDTAQDRSYTYTFVTSWGEESQPAVPSNSVLSGVGHIVLMSGFDATPGDEFDVVAVRLYCTNTGTSGNANFQFLAERPVGLSSFYHVIDDAALGETCPSMEWAQVPELDGMIGMANGMIIGYKGGDVIPLEAYRPFAAPEGYRLATDFKIVGGASFGNSAVLCTEGNPYLLNGNEPSSLALQKMEIPQACLSKRSISEVAGGVVYASPDGLIHISPNGSPTNLTEELFGKKDWLSLSPNSMHGYGIEDKYVGFYDTGSVRGGFVLDLRAKTFIFLDFYATAGFTDLIQDALYLKVGTNLVKFDHGVQEYTFTWKSKVFRLPKAENFSWAQCYAASYSSPITMKMYVDGVLKFTKSVTNQKPFRLPAGFKGLNYEIELTGNKEILSVHLATSTAELQSVI